MELINTDLDWIFRILSASLIGAAIGYERHNRSKEAGVRTHAIVAMASAMMMIISKYGFADAPGHDPSRIASTIITGISFLGAGIIFFKNESIQGLTTAAGIWATSGIGMAFGAGMYGLGVFCGILTIATQMILQHSFTISSPRATMHLRMYLKDDASIHRIVEYLNRNGYYTSDIDLKRSPDQEGIWITDIDITTFKDIKPVHIMEEISHKPQVEKVEAL